MAQHIQAGRTLNTRGIHMPLNEYCALEERAKKGDTAAVAELMRLAVSRRFVSRRAAETLRELGVEVAQ